MESDFGEAVSAAELEQREQWQTELGELKKGRVAAERKRAKCGQRKQALETELHEHLEKRQRELEEGLGQAEEEQPRRGKEAAAPDALGQAQRKLKQAEQGLADMGKRREELREQQRAEKQTFEKLKAQLSEERQREAEEAKELDKLLSRKQMLQLKLAEFTECIKKLGSLPKDAFDESRKSQTSKQLMNTIDKCRKELQKLGHVNKKALDQFANFNEQRDKLLERQGELDEAESSIKTLIEHLDHKKDEAMERTFKGVAKFFQQVFSELVPGGSGKMKMLTDHSGGASAASRVASYTGISIKVQFVAGPDTFTMEQLSGGQKTMVALCLIFAIQRTDPAPFYIFDEIDANLDAAHRASLARMIERQSADYVDESGEDRQGTQFITTTFRPELIHAGHKFYGVTHRGKASTVKSIDKKEALRIITEDQNRLAQHAKARE